jgi:hypothetical protein
MKPCIEFLRSRPARRYPSLPAELTLTKIPILPHCLGGRILWSSGPENFSDQDESRLHETTLTFDSKPALRVRSRCREAGQLALLRIIDGKTPLGRPHTGGRGFTPDVLRPAEMARGWEGVANDILTLALGHAKLFALRPRSVRPSHVPSGHPRPLHARPPSGPGHRYAGTEVDGVSRDGLMVSSRTSPYPPRDQHAR